MNTFHHSRLKAVHSRRPTHSYLCAAMLAALFPATAAQAQQPAVSVDGLPAEPLIGETFCIQVNFTNDAASTGYGPYLIGIVEEGIDNISIDFVDVTPQLAFIGTFGADGQLVDPVSESTITGSEGSNAWDVFYPVGGVEQSKPPLVLDVCSEVVVGTEPNEPLDVEIIPGFEFGDSATGPSGAGGTILGTPFTSTVTPRLARVEKSNTAPENERPPGPSHEYNYVYEVDISAGVTLDNVALSDPLPDTVQWTGGAIGITAPLGQGCAVSGDPLPGETLTYTIAFQVTDYPETPGAGASRFVSATSFRTA